MSDTPKSDDPHADAVFALHRKRQGFTNAPSAVAQTEAGNDMTGTGVKGLRSGQELNNQI